MIDFKSLIINLKILGHLKTGIKINARENFFELDGITLYQGIVRMYRRDDRNVTYEKITFLVKDLFDLIDPKPSQDSDKTLHDVTGHMFNTREEFNEYMHPLLISAITGLETLKVTYKEDETFIAKLELELDRLSRILTILEDYAKN